MRRFKCWIEGHDYRIVGEWRKKRVDASNALARGLLGYGFCSDMEGNTYAGGGIRVQCEHCGNRTYAEFRRTPRKHLWVTNGIDEYIEPQWQVVVRGYHSVQPVNGGPSSDEIAEEVKR